MPVSDYRDVLSYYSTFCSPRDTRADYVQGEKDGAGNKPRSDATEMSGYELDIVNQARADLARFRLQLHLDSHGCQAAVTARRQQRYEEYESELRDLAHRHDSRVAAINTETGPASGLAKRNQERLFEAEQRYLDLRRELDRDPSLHFVARLPLIGLSGYTLLLGAMAFVELFINNRVFITMLGNVLNGYAGAMILGLAIVFFSHILGIFVRQAKVRRRPAERLRLWLGVPLIIAVVTTALWQVAVLRQDELAGSAGGPTGLLGLSTEAWLLFMLNFGVFVAGFFLSFFRHDPHPDYEGLWRDHDRALDAEQDRRARFEAEVGVVNDEYRRKRGNIAARADRLQREIDDDLTQSESLPGREEAEVQKVIAVVTQRILAYQSGNERARDAARPRYFGHETVRRAEAIIRGEDWSVAPPARATSFAES